MKRLVTCSLSMCLLAGLVYVSGRNAYTFAPLDRRAQEATIGGDKPVCNHKEQKQYCTTGTQSCSASCTAGESGQRCDSASSNSGLHATSGSIYVCYTAAGENPQTDCRGLGSGHDQSCVMDKDCVCRSKLLGGYECKSEAGSGTITMEGVSSTTDCTN